MKRKLDRPGSGVAPKPLDDVERELVRADIKYLIEKEKESGVWAKWDRKQREVDPDYDNYKSRYNSGPTIRPEAITVRPDIIEPQFTSIQVSIVISDISPDMGLRAGQITPEIFQRYVGRAPVQDELERCNCLTEGYLGHLLCGWCGICNKPRYICGHWANVG
jgi:hypothetical protein